MAGPCAPLQSGPGFVRGVLDFIDCQAQSIGAEGYQALSMPGSTFALLLTGLLTIFVALFGYRTLFGHGPGVRDAVLALVKIGIVLALATNWPAYRTLAYDVVLRGPAELAADIGLPAGLPGAGGGLVDRLVFIDNSFVALATVGIGAAPRELPTAIPQPTPPFPGFDSFAIGGSRVAFLVATIGALAAVRLIAGLLLALGPFFIAFLLFDGTRGLFNGWVRGLAATMLGAVGTAIVLGVELALMEPWLADLLARRAIGETIPAAPAELLVLTLAFALGLLAMLVAAARVAFGFRLPEAWREVPVRAVSALRGGLAETAPLAARATTGNAPAADRPRAANVVAAIAASQRRESAVTAAIAGAGPGVARPASMRDMPVPATVALGQSYRRRTTTRVSSSAGARDRVR